MTPQELDEIRARALDHVNEGRMDDALADFELLAQHDPDAADGWINLAAAERGVGRLHLAREHFERGIALLERGGAEDRGLLATALHALGTTLEGLDLTDLAAKAFRRSASCDPRAPTPLASLAELLARAGHLKEADKVATEYCMAAVSVLAEKANIALVRKFQKALKDAASVDGNLILLATREAYLHGFDVTVKQLPPGVQTEVEPTTCDAQGNRVPVLANPNRPFSRVRFDAVQPQTGERWMIHDAPTYGFPKDCTAAADGLFSVPHAAGTPFPVLLCTRTAWDYFFVRLRFQNGLQERTVARAEELLGAWYLEGQQGRYGKDGRGFFHYLSQPTAIGDHGLRYEVDLGLASIDCIPALFEVLTRLHADHPIAVAVVGDGALPLEDF